MLIDYSTSAYAGVNARPSAASATSSSASWCASSRKRVLGLDSQVHDPGGSGRRRRDSPHRSVHETAVAGPAVGDDPGPARHQVGHDAWGARVTPGWGRVCRRLTLT